MSPLARWRCGAHRRGMHGGLVTGRVHGPLASLVLTMVGVMGLVAACGAPPRVTPRATTTTTTTTAPAPAPAPAPVGLQVMQPRRVDAAALVAWFDSKRVSGARPPVPVADLARYFVEEGDREHVAGDLAFVQAMLETGWLRFSERMPPSNNNFSGIGALDGGTGSASFATARQGIRAQVQHLRAYADASVTEARLTTPLVDPRFHLVSPKGRAPSWTQFGNGVWATDPDYADKVGRMYRDLLAHSGVRVGP